MRAAAWMLALAARGGADDALDLAQQQLKQLQAIAQQREAGGPPGTPPTKEDLQGVVRAARERQKYLCGVWPAAGNDGCQLLRGDAKWQSVPASAADGALERKLAWKIVLRDEPFNFRVMGSSSSAAHGAWLNASYAYTAAAAARPAFAAIGIDFVGLNQAMGSVDYRRGPLWCLAQIAGLDADMVTWEWGMFGPDYCSLEQWLRNIAAMPRRPSTLFVHTSGPSAGGNFWGQFYYKYCGKKSAKEAQMCEKIFGREGAGGGAGAMKLESNCRDSAAGPSTCGPPPILLPCMDGAPPDARSWDNFIRDSACVDRWARAGNMLTEKDPVWKELSDAYFGSEKRPSGMPDSPPNEQGTMAKQFGEWYAPHLIGAHYMRSGSASNVDWQPWWISRMALFRSSHHPGSLGHVYVGHTIGYWVLERLAAAAELALRELGGGEVDALAKTYREERSRHRRRELPPALWCSKPGLEAGDAQRHRCFTEFLPRADAAGDIRSHVESATGWRVQDLPGSAKYPDDGRGYRDHKLFADASAAGGTLLLKLGKAPEGSPSNQVDVVVCGDLKPKGALVTDCGVDSSCMCPSGGRGCCRDAKLRAAAELSIPWHGGDAAKPKPPAGRQPPPPKEKGDGVRITSGCYAVCTVPAGSDAKVTLTAESLPVRVSHVALIDSDSPPGSSPKP